MKSYAEPIMEILLIGQLDVVRTSDLNGFEEGDGSFGSVEDLI